MKKISELFESGAREFTGNFNKPEGKKLLNHTVTLDRLREWVKTIIKDTYTIEFTTFSKCFSTMTIEESINEYIRILKKETIKKKLMEMFELTEYDLK